MGDDGRLRIADFGVCNEFQGAEDAWLDNTVGTPAFLAPEALVGKFSGKAADIWSMGITLYAFVYGILPFFDMNIVALYGLIQHQGLKFPPSPTISAKLKDLLIRMLSKDPSQRITLPEIKNHSWVTCDGTQPLPAEEDNCCSGPVEVTAEDLDQSVRSIPHLASLILVKAMLRKHSFQHPFKGTNPFSFLLPLCHLCVLQKLILIVLLRSEFQSECSQSRSFGNCGQAVATTFSIRWPLQFSTGLL